MGVEESVGVVYEAEEHGYHFFQPTEHLPLPVSVHSDDYPLCARFSKKTYLG
jgi:hypothetical protein